MTSLQVTFLSPTGSLNKRVELSIGNHGSLVRFSKFSFNLVEQALLRSSACFAYIELGSDPNIHTNVWKGILIVSVL